MSSIKKYLTEELNRIKVEDNACSKEISSLNKENTDIRKKIKVIQNKYDSTFNVFHVATDEELLDQKKIEELSNVLEQNNKKITSINENKIQIEERQKLVQNLIYEDINKKNNNELLNKADFILKLIDVDNTRAKVELQELINIIKANK